MYEMWIESGDIKVGWAARIHYNTAQARVVDDPSVPLLIWDSANGPFQYQGALKRIRGKAVRKWYRRRFYADGQLKVGAKP